ncbi:MAG: HEAT repeat domain-containing protein [Planctomycetota bacterium]
MDPALTPPAVPFLIGLLADNATLAWRRSGVQVAHTSPAQEAVRALARIGRPAVDPLIEVLQDEGARSVIRSGAAEALGHIGDKKALDPLLKALRYRDSGGVRPTVAEALGRLGDPNAVDPLLEAFQAEHAGVARDEVATALGMIGDERAVPVLARAVLDPALRSSHREVVQALGKIGDPRGVEPLIGALGDPKLFDHAIEALAAIGRPSRGPLLAALRGDDASVREGAAAALGHVGDHSAVKPLVARLEDRDPRVRARAAESLGHIGRRDATGGLIRALADTRPAVAEEAEQALSHIDPDWHDGSAAKETAADLLEQLRAPAGGPQSRAWVVLDRIDPDWRRPDVTTDIVRRLIRALPDVDGEARDCLLTQLAGVDPGWRRGAAAEAVVDDLIGDLEQGDRASKRAAQEVLEELSGKHFGADSQAWRTWRAETGWSSQRASGRVVPAMRLGLTEEEFRRRVAERVDALAGTGIPVYAVVGIVTGDAASGGPAAPSSDDTTPEACYVLRHHQRLVRIGRQGPTRGIPRDPADRARALLLAHDFPSADELVLVVNDVVWSNVRDKTVTRLLDRLLANVGRFYERVPQFAEMLVWCRRSLPGQGVAEAEDGQVDVDRGGMIEAERRGRKPREGEPLEAMHILLAHDQATLVDGRCRREVTCTKAEALLKAKVLLAKLRGGTDRFADLAGRWSDCPTAASGGRIGGFAPGTMLPKFEDAVRDLKVGALSDVVETEVGFHLIRRVK